MSRKHVSLKDMAVELGLSISTVSRALNGNPDISASVAQRVRDLALKWNYSPNPFAMGLLRSNTKMIGVIVPDLVTHFYASIISGIEDVAREHGYYIVITTSSEQIKKESEAVDNLLKTRVEGIIACISEETNKYDHFAGLADYEVPLVFFDRVCLTDKFSSVVANNRDSAFRLTSHLIENNSHCVAYIGGPDYLNISRERVNGFLGALAKNGIPIRKEYILKGPLSFGFGEEATRHLLSLPERPDALVCMNDTLAFAAIRELKKNGLSIPGDIVVGSFTDEFHATVLEPPLTAISHPTFAIGRRAGELLFAKIAGDKTVVQSVMDCDLQVRASSVRTVS